MFQYSLKEIHQILQNINDGVFILDKNDNTVYVNIAGEKYLGKRRNQLLNKNFWSVFSVGQESKFYQKFKLAVKENNSKHIFEYSDVLKKWIDGNIYPYENGIIAIFRDVSNLVENQNKLLEDQRNFSAILDSTSDAMWLIDKNYRIIVANKAFYRLFEDMNGIIIGSKIVLSDFTNEERAKWGKCYEQALKGEPSDFIDENIVKGEVKYFRNMIEPVFENDNITAINCQCRDVTERILRVRKIEAQNKLLSEIAHSQSHNVRRPIATILGLLELIDPDEFEYSENVEMLRNLKMMALEIDVVIKECVKEINKIENLERIKY